MHNFKNGKKLPHYGERVTKKRPFAMKEIYRVLIFTERKSTAFFAKLQNLVGIPQYRILVAKTIYATRIWFLTDLHRKYLYASRNWPWKIAGNPEIWSIFQYETAGPSGKFRNKINIPIFLHLAKPSRRQGATFRNGLQNETAASIGR